MDDGNRHLSRQAHDQYLADAVPGALVVPGEPYCRVIVEPTHQRMALRTPFRPQSTVDVTGFERVTTRTVASEGSRWSEVVIEYGEDGPEAYLLLCDVADLMQLRGLTFDKAVQAALTTFDDLLARARGLSSEKQIGLYGELLFIESCLREKAPVEVLDAWRGFAHDEHDFVFPGVCFEVKTTRSERRKHRISGLAQMQPVPGAVLWLLSLQVTSSSPEAGRTLVDLVDDVRTALGASTDRFDRMLAQLGWRERDRPLYGDAMTLRTPPTAYPVDGDFPVLDRGVVDHGCARPELIVDAAYTVDLTSLETHTPPAPAARFVDGNH